MEDWSAAERWWYIGLCASLAMSVGNIRSQGFSDPISTLLYGLMRFGSCVFALWIGRLMGLHVIVDLVPIVAVSAAMFIIASYLFYRAVLLNNATFQALGKDFSTEQCITCLALAPLILGVQVAVMPFLFNG